jgi:hypothetical protein
MTCRSERLPVLLLATLAAGCLSTPSGLPPGTLPDAGAQPDAGPDQPDGGGQTTGDWPVTGVTVAAAAAGDLDGDGDDDLVVVASAPQPALYVLEGTDDVHPGEGATAYSQRVVLPRGAGLGAVGVAVVDVDGTAPLEVLVAGDADSGAELWVYRGAGLAPVGQADLGGAAPADAPIWVGATPFGPGGTFMFIGVGESVMHISLTELAQDPPTPRTLPGPGGGFGGPQGVTSYADGDAYAVVLGSETAWRGLFTGGPFTWMATRPAEAWLGQLALDVDGNDGSIPEIVGYSAAAGGQLCAYDLVEDFVDCAALALTDATDVRIVPLRPEAAVLELVVVAHRAGSSDVILARAVTLDTATDTLAIDATASMTGLPAGVHAVVGDFAADDRYQIMVVAPDGTVTCLRPDGASTTLVECGQP